MTKDIQFFYPPNTLGNAMKKPGGISISDALVRANSNLDDIRDTCLVELDGKIAAIEKAAGSATVSPDQASLNRIYTLGNEILGEAGALGLIELSTVGRSLCELTSVPDEATKVDPRMIRVHIDAMKSLRRPEADADPKMRTALLNGLRKMTSKVVPS